MNKKNLKHNKIKIIHIAQSAGGVAEYLKNFLKHIDTNKYENILVASNDYKKVEKEFNKITDKLKFVDMVREINFLKDLKAIIKIRKIIKKEKPNLIYLHSSKAGALGRIAVLLTSDIIIYNAHGWYFNADIGKKRIIYQIIEKILAFRAQKIVAISKSEYESAIEKKICKDNKLVLIENGIDIKKYDLIKKDNKSLREKYAIPQDAIIIGIVGRISEQKDPITSIKAAEKLISENNNIYFVFVGIGELENEVINYAREKGIINNIIITGWVENVKDHIEMFDIALLPSKWEGFGLAIIEYMICKKPIITTKVGGIADILNKEKSAFFIEKGSYQDIVNNTKYILNHPNEVEKIVEANYIECKTRFSIDKQMNYHDELFEKLCKKGENNEKDYK